MRRLGFVFVVTVLMSVLTLSPAIATSLSLTPSDQLFNIGDTLTYELFADIDLADEIMGFGFDLSFDGGATSVSGPGDSGSALTFDSFTPGGLFTYDWLFDSDLDTISGVILPDPFTGSPVSGTGIKLGTFQFTAFALNPETIWLGADSLGLNGEEGLIPAAFGSGSFMPNTPSADANPVPEPGTLLILSLALIAAAGFKKKFN